jgi:hypothetical protein
MHTVLAVILATLPVRWWPAFEERFPLYRMAWVSGLAAMLAGIALGVPGYINFVLKATDGVNRGLIGAQSDLVQIQGWGVASLPLFLFATPTGLASLYLTASGFLRAVAAFLTEEVRGDYLLTGLDALVVRCWTKRTRARAAASRQRREGAEAPDRLVTGAQIGRPEIELAVLASRLKPLWEPNTYLVEPDGRAFQLGPPFDVETRRGLRAAYPLRELKTGEAIRHSIPYELPPHWRGPLRTDE